MKFEHFFWDFDGTLFDTYPRITKAFMKALAEYGITADPEEALRRIKQTLGSAADYYARKSGIDALTGDKLVKAYRKYSEQEDPDEIRLYPGAEEALRRVIQRGGANYLYTHRGETAWPYIKRFGIDDLFFDGVTALNGFPAKPDPEALLFLIEKHHLQKERCAMVGDRSIDMDAAANAGIAGILFDPEGFCDTPVPYQFATMKELADTLM